MLDGQQVTKGTGPTLFREGRLLAQAWHQSRGGGGNIRESRRLPTPGAPRLTSLQQRPARHPQMVPMTALRHGHLKQEIKGARMWQGG